MLHPSRTVVLAAFLALWPGLALAASEFQVSSEGPGVRYGPEVAVSRDGGFLVVWGEYEGVFARRFAAGGTPRGGAFQVGSAGSHYLLGIHAASDPEGFSVVWDNYHKYAGSSSRFLRLGRNGAPVKSETFLDNLGLPDVTTGGQGDSWVVSGDGTRLIARHLDRLGRAVGRPVRVTSSDAVLPRIARIDEGRFAVVWRSSKGIFGRLLDGDGERGPGFAVTRDASAPSLASNGQGLFAAAWLSDQQRVRLRLFSSSGTPRTGIIDVTEASRRNLEPVSVAMDADGGVLVVWSACPQPFTVCHVAGRRYESTGAPAGRQFRISAGPRDFDPAAAGGPSGRFVVVWRRDPGPDSAIVGRRLTLP